MHQVGCSGQEDSVRPYSCLPYAWDEPSLPVRQLAVTLPGGGRVVLGKFALDELGQRCEVAVPRQREGGSRQVGH